jgi:hypothetical protein
MKKEHYSNFCTFEIASLVNVPGHYLRKYSMCRAMKLYTLKHARLLFSDFFPTLLRLTFFHVISERLHPARLLLTEF